MVVENTNFWKKGKLSSEEKFLAYFFSYFRVSKTSGSETKVQGVFRHLIGSYQIVFLDLRGR